MNLLQTFGVSVIVIALLSVGAVIYRVVAELLRSKDEDDEHYSR